MRSRAGSLGYGVLAIRSPLPYGSVIAPIAKAYAVKPCADAGPDGALTQTTKPARKRLVARRRLDEEGLRLRLPHGLKL